LFSERFNSAFSSSNTGKFCGDNYVKNMPQYVRSVFKLVTHASNDERESNAMWIEMLVASHACMLGDVTICRRPVSTFTLCTVYGYCCGRVMLKHTLQKEDARMGLDSAGTEQGPVVCHCKHNKFSCFMKGGAANCGQNFS
jgi:hypothetical protein